MSNPAPIAPPAAPKPVAVKSKKGVKKYDPLTGKKVK